MRISDWSSDVCSSDLPYQATEILDRHDNFHELDYLASPLHGTKALICEAHGTKTETAHLFRNLGKGYEPLGMLNLCDKALSSWLWYIKGDSLTTARQITYNQNSCTVSSAQDRDTSRCSGEMHRDIRRQSWRE